MLRSYPEAREPWSHASWLDLVHATDEERAAVERATRLRVPDQAAVQEIETTSRVYTKDGAMYLSTPIPASAAGAEPLNALGFVLTKRLLISVRFSENPVVDALFRDVNASAGLGAAEIFMRILEAFVDRAADTLEHCSAELDDLSRRAFHSEPSGRSASAKPVSDELRGTLRKLGQTGDHISQIRDTLLGLGRIAAFVCDSGDSVLSKEERPRLVAVRSDIASLNDYQQHLSGKVQFLLDATLGFINIEQNDVVRVLTIASVVGVPPVLIAGVYGMNFSNMPELHWRLGYPFALALMALTGVIPLLWFKRRGWM